MAEISAIVLAAGRSQRFGRDKRLELIDATPMFLLTALKLKAVIADTLVVLGPQDEVHQRLLCDRGLDFVVCPDARRGMAHSLAYGVAQRPNASGWLIMPADMPFIQEATLLALIRASRGQALAAPVCRGRRGHPVWFEHAYYQSLCALTGDQGARSVLNGAQATLHQIPVDDTGCLLDIDKPQDLPDIK